MSLDSSLRDFEDFLQNARSLDELKNYFQISPGLSERMEVYQNGFWVRLRSVLEKSFPATRSFLSESKWNSLGPAYVLNSKLHSNLSYVGQGFDRFLLEHKEDFASELARLEWQILELDEVKSKSDISDFDFSKICERSKLKFLPEFRIFRSEYPVVSYWLKRESLEGPEAAALFRKDFQVFVEWIPLYEYELLNEVQSSRALGEFSDFNERTARLIAKRLVAQQIEISQ